MRQLHTGLLCLLLAVFPGKNSFAAAKNVANDWVFLDRFSGAPPGKRVSLPKFSPVFTKAFETSLPKVLKSFPVVKIIANFYSPECLPKEDRKPTELRRRAAPHGALHIVMDRKSLFNWLVQELGLT